MVSQLLIYQRVRLCANLLWSDLAARYPDLVTYVPVLSRPAEARNAQWTGATGRVSGLLAQYINRFALAPRSTQLYTCGHALPLPHEYVRLSPVFHGLPPLTLQVA